MLLNIIYSHIRTPYTEFLQLCKIHGNTGLHAELSEAHLKQRNCPQNIATWTSAIKDIFQGNIVYMTIGSYINVCQITFKSLATIKYIWISLIGLHV